MYSIFTLEKIFKAYNDCRKGKNRTANALIFEFDREKNLLSLLEELSSRKYVPSRHICFVVKTPVPREIFAADFRDRIVHHLFYNELNMFCGKSFIHHSYANRINKGTHRAVNVIKEFVRHNPDGYYLKLDVRSFFPSINRQILFKLVERNICLCMENDEGKSLWSLIEKNKWKEEMIYLTRIIIFYNPTKNFIYKGDPKLRKLIPNHKSLFYSGIDKGLPIGNLTSQFFANVYLNLLDQFVTRTLLCRNYARYVDDFIMIDVDKSKLLLYVNCIKEFLKEKLNLDLHPDKIILQHVSRGIDFLGYFIKPTHTLVRQRVVNRFKKQLYKRRNNEDGLFSMNDTPMIKSYLGHFKHANTFNLKKKLLK
jgi:RNA-directed DNA polymerase